MAETTEKRDWETPVLTTLGDLETLTGNVPPNTGTDGLSFTS